MATGITLLALLHIIIAVLLVTFVLLQDGKGGGIGSSFGSESSQSLFGATGATNLLVKVTRVLAVCFMISCIVMTLLLNRSSSRSVVDGLPAAAPAAPVSPESAAPAPAAPAQPAQSQAPAEQKK